MTENTTLWDKLGKTDPKHTKKFKRGGGFSGTAIKPMWSYRRMTEEFGPCGEGWGVGEPTFKVVPGVNQEIMVYCTASIWYRPGRDATAPARTVYGVGGDKIVTHIKANEEYRRPERWENDDEAFKKAFTDAVTNALKLIGVGADVHMGMFDDNKYVNTIAREFAEEQEEPAAPPAKSSAQLKRDGFWPDFERELAECQSLVMLEKFKAAWREKAVKDGWNAAFKSAARDRIEGREREIMNANEATYDDAFPGDLPPAVRADLKRNPIMAG